MMTDYTPIDCAAHSAYEIAILQKRPLRVSWRDPEHGQTRLETLMPIDLLTRNHEEFLVTETPAGKTRTLRLDHIIKYESI
jgi:transcriptional antiterminator Rof (Rho-off)